MQHPDPDDLALFAIEGRPDAELTAHLADCALCRADVEAFQQTVELAQLSNYGELAPRPSENVWAAISAELGFGEQAASVANAVPASRTPSSTEGLPTAPVADPPPAQELYVTPVADPPPGVDDPADPTVAETTVADFGAAKSRQRSWKRWAAPIAALIIGAALGAGAVALAQRDTVSVEAIAPLTPVAGGPLPDTAAELGKAELVFADQRQRIHVDAPDLPAISGAYEVWLFGADGKMVSLGSLDNGVGDFAVPQGINTGEYRTVDVSDEPADGNPAHSGISVVRGSFS